MRTTSLLSLALAVSAGAQTLQIPQGGTGGDTAGKAAANLAIIQKCPGTSGVGTAYVCVTSGTFTPADGSTINFQPDVNSGATPTLSVNTHSATIKTIGGGAIGASDLLAGNWYLVTYHTTGSTYWSVNLAGTSGITQLTGDGAAGPGSGSQALTLATVNSGPGSCGDATNVCQITTNGKGLVTAQTPVAIAVTAYKIVAVWSGASGTIVDDGQAGSGYESGATSWGTTITGAYNVWCTTQGWTSGTNIGQRSAWTAFGTPIDGTTFSYAIDSPAISQPRGHTVSTVICMAIQ